MLSGFLFHCHISLTETLILWISRIILNFVLSKGPSLTEQKIERLYVKFKKITGMRWTHVMKQLCVRALLRMGMI